MFRQKEVLGIHDINFDDHEWLYRQEVERKMREKKEQKKQISSLSSVRPPIPNGGILWFPNRYRNVAIEPNELNTTHPAPPLSPNTETGQEELTVEIKGIQVRI